LTAPKWTKNLSWLNLNFSHSQAIFFHIYRLERCEIVERKKIVTIMPRGEKMLEEAFEQFVQSKRVKAD